MPCRAEVVLAVLLAVLGAVPAAEAQFSTLPISKCNAAKVKVVGKTAAKLLGCHRKGGPDLALCLTKIGDKFDPAEGKGAFTKISAKGQGCIPGTPTS